MAEFNHGIGLIELMDRYLPVPGSNREFDPLEIVDAVVLMLEELTREWCVKAEGMMKTHRSLI